MTYEQYWEQSPYLVKAYMKAHEYYIEQKNQELYMQGLYNYRAFAAVIDSFAYSLNGCKGKKPEPYMEYPFAITKHEKMIEEQRKAEKSKKWFESQK